MDFIVLLVRLGRTVLYTGKGATLEKKKVTVIFNPWRSKYSFYILGLNQMILIWVIQLYALVDAVLH